MGKKIAVARLKTHLGDMLDIISLAPIGHVSDLFSFAYCGEIAFRGEGRLLSTECTSRYVVAPDTAYAALMHWAVWGSLNETVI